VVIAHNAPFDLMIIKKENIIPNKFICTLRVARELDKEGKIERYNLQYLRYLLEIEVEAVAHDAMGDVLVLEKLFERLKNKIMKEENLTEEQAIEKMVEISSHPSLLRTFSFGKHNGKKIEEVLATDRGYLEWLLAQKLESDQIEDDWIYTLKHHLEK
jgi:DNA polymerase III epsilon subunit-like protein